MPYIPFRDPCDICQAEAPHSYSAAVVFGLPTEPSPWLLGGINRMFMKDLRTGAMREVKLYESIRPQEYRARIQRLQVRPIRYDLDDSDVYIKPMRIRDFRLVHCLLLFPLFTHTHFVCPQVFTSALPVPEKLLCC